MNDPTFNFYSRFLHICKSSVAFRVWRQLGIIPLSFPRVFKLPSLSPGKDNCECDRFCKPAFRWWEQLKKKKGNFVLYSGNAPTPSELNALYPPHTPTHLGPSPFTPFWCKTLYILSDYLNYSCVWLCLPSTPLLWQLGFAQGSPWWGLARGWRWYKTSSNVNSKILIALKEQVTFTCAPPYFKPKSYVNREVNITTRFNALKFGS